MGERPNPVREKSYRFAVRIVALARRLRASREYDLARQLLRAGTNIGANVEEAQAATTRRDFVAKMSVALKEGRETHYWLRLLRDTAALPENELGPMIGVAEELVRLLSAIVKTGQTTR